VEISNLTPSQSAVLTRRVTLLSVAVAGTLVVLKAVVWIASGSVALMASMADSGLDLIASMSTFFAVRYAAAPPDAEHRFGHGKAEAFASLIQAGLVFASAALVGQEAIRRIVEPRAVDKGVWAIGAMGVSTVLTACLIAAQTRMLRRAASVAVSSDRAHYAADLASNIIALVGIGAATLLQLNRLDAVAGLAIAAVLLWGAIAVFRQSSSQLMDHELSDEARARIISIMKADPRVKGVHQLRTRAAGPTVHIQMHADLDPTLTFEAAHHVVVKAEKRVLDAFPAADVLIHADPQGRAEPHGGEFAETSSPRVR